MPEAFRHWIIIARVTAWIVCALCVAPVTPAEEPPLPERLARLIETTPGFPDRPAPPTNDADFHRRVRLDVTGLIPTADEARRFIKEENPSKRVWLVDELLGSPAYARHMQNTIDVLLMQNRAPRYVKRDAWDNYLYTSFLENKPWDQLVRELFTADGTKDEDKAAIRFIVDRRGGSSEIVRDISTVLLGKNLRCAQCHDHPIVMTYEQSHFYGIAAFIDRSYVFQPVKDGPAYIGEKAEGETKFVSALTQVGGTAVPTVFDSTPIVEPTLEKGTEYIVAPSKDKLAVPKFSRRSQLAPTLINHPAFARNIVNRLWAMVMGRGIVEPVDFHHKDNPPSHPALLDLLAREFVASKYDLQALLRELLLTKTYARAAQAESSESPFAPNLFAAQQLRPLAPRSLAWSLLRATGRESAAANENSPDGSQEKKQSTETTTLTRETIVYNRLRTEAAAIAKTFLTSLEGQEEQTDATPDQALFLMNSETVVQWLQPAPGNLIDRLSQVNGTDRLGEHLFLSILGRFPDAEERQRVRSYLESLDAKDRDEGLADLAWALLCSAEFRFNH